MVMIDIVHIGLHRTGTTFLQKEIFSKMPNVLSSEDLSGYPFYKKNFTQSDRVYLLECIRNYFGDIKIILCLRNKSDWLHSCYNHFVLTSGHFFKSFNFWYDNYFNHSYLDFENYVTMIKDRFTNTFIYNYDNFIKDKEKTVNDMFDFIGKKVDWDDKIYNKSVSNNKLRLVKCINFIHEAVK